MPTLRDVATLAGVSVATVSNVVKDARRVSPATRARVEEAMARLNYAPARNVVEVAAPPHADGRQAFAAETRGDSGTDGGAAVAVAASEPATPAKAARSKSPRRAF